MVSANDHNAEAERCLLGSILLKPEVLPLVEHVEASDFEIFKPSMQRFENCQPAGSESTP